jgi:hypothetical protein
MACSKASFIISFFYRTLAFSNIKLSLKCKSLFSDSSRYCKANLINEILELIEAKSMQ